MRCEKVLGHLSLFHDDMLEEPLAAKILEHLEDCAECSKEAARLKNLQLALRGLAPVGPPDYLQHLVNLRIVQARQNSWHENFKSSLAYGWSKVRTTEGRWYVTRLMGAMATVVFFLAISAAMSPMYLELGDQGIGYGDNRSQQLTINLQRGFGSPVEAQKRPIPSSVPKINDEYLALLAARVSATEQDDTVSVFSLVDSSGAAKVQDILEHPTDDSLLNDVTDMINSAGWRPASQNGRAVNSPLVFTFTKIYVRN
jgi:hypothetical protein